MSRVLKKISGIDCPAKTIREEDLQAAVLTAVNDTFNKKDEITPILMGIIQEVINEDSQESLDKLDVRIKEQQIRLIETGNDQKIIDEIGDKIISLRKEKQDIMTKAAKNIELQERINDMCSFWKEQTQVITEYSDTLVRRLIEKITIYDNKAVVEFKYGLQSEVEI